MAPRPRCDAPPCRQAAFALERGLARRRFHQRGLSGVPRDAPRTPRDARTSARHTQRDTNDGFAVDRGPVGRHEGVLRSADVG
eukprot:77476-Prymnesium_polylepis.2